MEVFRPWEEMNFANMESLMEAEFLSLEMQVATSGQERENCRAFLLIIVYESNEAATE
jgi:hypothetical protein